MAPDRGPSVFPIALPTVLGDTLSVRKIRVRNSGVGNGCANFMDTWKKCVLSAGKTMSVKFPFLGGGFWGGGGSADFIFMGARIFLSFTA